MYLSHICVFMYFSIFLSNESNVLGIKHLDLTKWCKILYLNKPSHKPKGEEGGQRFALMQRGKENSGMRERGALIRVNLE